MKQKKLTIGDSLFNKYFLLECKLSLMDPEDPDYNETYKQYAKALELYLEYQDREQKRKAALRKDILDTAKAAALVGLCIVGFVGPMRSNKEINETLENNKRDFVDKTESQKLKDNEKRMNDISSKIISKLM